MIKREDYFHIHMDLFAFNLPFGYSLYMLSWQPSVYMTNAVIFILSALIMKIEW